MHAVVVELSGLILMNIPQMYIFICACMELVCSLHPVICYCKQFVLPVAFFQFAYNTLDIRIDGLIITVHLNTLRTGVRYICTSISA